MKVALVIHGPRKTGPLQKIYKIAEYPILPSTRDTDIEYQDGWGLSNIDRIYLLQSPGLPELFLGYRPDTEHYNKLLELGWSEEFPNVTEIQESNSE